MADLTTFTESEKQSKALTIQNSATEKTGFIAARLNRDNFWNLIFFIGVVGLVGASELIARNIDRSLILPITIPVLILTTYLFSKLIKTVQSNKTLVKGKFVFGQTLLAASVLTVAFIVFPFFLLEGKIFLKLLITNIVAWFISISTLYCIIKNLSLSVYFHKNAWYVKDFQFNQSNNTKHHESLSSPSNMLTNPINSWYSGNIFHKK